jgi:predicted nucleic acid-binding protein
LTVYADTSFFVSLYTVDTHSTASRELLKSGVRVWFTPLHFGEWTHAIAQQVFHRRASAEAAEQAYLQMKKDRDGGLWVESSIPERAFDICADLARKFGPRLGTRTLDSLHVACALELKAERFWTFDERQAKLAKAAGLKTS